MKRILVIHYSQTGQLTELINSILSPLQDDGNIAIEYESLNPIPDYPFPWTAYRFCDVFPESVAEIPGQLRPFQCDLTQDFDLIILAYTVWYLSPSIPISTFLQSPEAKDLFKGTPILTLIGCRNMWLMAHEKIKRYIARYQGQHLGNIAVTEKTSNLVGVLTIAVWMLSGKKEPFLHLFPRPGIGQEDINKASKFGEVLKQAIKESVLNLDQQELNRYGAVSVDPGLLIMEKRVAKVFRIWSKFIRKKGPQGDPRRSKRTYAFMIYLILAVIILAPLSRIASWLIQKTRKDKIQNEIDYYLQNSYKDLSAS